MTAEDWDASAPTFDDQPDHGLRDPAVRAAWTDLLTTHLPAAPASVLDLGCGTATLAVLLGTLGYPVTGLDSSRRMLEQAQQKADQAGVAITLLHGDAASPPTTDRFDVLLCRHVLWAFENPEEVVARWRSLLAPGGRLLLIEGFWSTGAGFPAADLMRAVTPSFGTAQLVRLTDPALWGHDISDERYLIVAQREHESPGANLTPRQI